MSFCTECGAPVAPGNQFCTACGARVEDIERPLVPPVDEQPQRRGWAIPVLAAALAVLMAVGAFWLWRGRQAPATPLAVGQSPAPSAATAGSEPGGTPSNPAFVARPSQALRLTKAEALAELREKEAAGREAVRHVRGSWVPQISSKCAGMDRTIDYGRGFLPDGRPGNDITTPSIQQVLAFQRAFADEYDTETVLWSDITSHPPAVCSGDSLWVAFVNKPMGTAGAVNGWCDRKAIPLNDCFAARYPANGHGTVEVDTRS